MYKSRATLPCVGYSSTYGQPNPDWLTLRVYGNSGTCSKGGCRYPRVIALLVRQAQLGFGNRRGRRLSLRLFRHYRIALGNLGFAN